MLENARAHPGNEIRVVLAGRSPYLLLSRSRTACRQESSRGLEVVAPATGLEAVWLAVSHRLVRGEIDPPPEWMRFVLGAFFPEVIFVWMRGY